MAHGLLSSRQLASVALVVALRIASCVMYCVIVSCVQVTHASHLLCLSARTVARPGLAHHADSVGEVRSGRLGDAEPSLEGSRAHLQVVRAGHQDALPGLA